MFKFLNSEKRHLKKEYEKDMPRTILYPSFFQLGQSHPLTQKEVQQNFLLSNSKFTDELKRELPFNTISIGYSPKEKDLKITSANGKLTESDVLYELINQTKDYFLKGGDGRMTVFNGLELDCIEENETGFYPRYITLLDYPLKDKD